MSAFRFFSLLTLIFQASLALAYDPIVLTLPVAVEKCEMLLLERGGFLSHNLFHQHWIEYGSIKITVKANIDGDDFVYLKDESDKFYRITNPEQVRALTQYFYTKMAPKGTDLVIVDYPKIGKGFAYRGLKKGLYVENLVADKDGVIQIPGLPPIYERKIGDKTYIDIPHPDVFNAYLGRKFFVSYTSTVYGRYAGEIPGPEYADIISQDRFPIANVNSDLFTLTHDIFGHAIIMAHAKDHDVWKKTVDISSRAIKIQKSLNSEVLGYKRARALDEKADYVLIKLSFWELAANTSGISHARTQADVDKSIATVTEAGRRGIAAGEKAIKELEAEYELILKEIKKD